MAEARPLRDHKQPTGEAARRIVSVDVSERLQKRLLRQVFGVVPVPRQLPEKVENPLPVAFDERFERLPATGLSFLSELFRTRFWPAWLAHRLCVGTKCECVFSRPGAAPVSPGRRGSGAQHRHNPCFIPRANHRDSVVFLLRRARVIVAGFVLFLAQQSNRFSTGNSTPTVTILSSPDTLTDWASCIKSGFSGWLSEARATVP